RLVVAEHEPCPLYHHTKEPTRIITYHAEASRESGLITLDSVGRPEIACVVCAAVPRDVLVCRIAICFRHSESSLAIVICNSFDQRYPRANGKRNEMPVENRIANRNR